MCEVFPKPLSRREHQILTKISTINVIFFLNPNNLHYLPKTKPLSKDTNLECPPSGRKSFLQIVRVAHAVIYGSSLRVIG